MARTDAVPWNFKARAAEQRDKSPEGPSLLRNSDETNPPHASTNTGLESSKNPILGPYRRWCLLYVHIENTNGVSRSLRIMRFSACHPRLTPVLRRHSKRLGLCSTTPRASEYMTTRLGTPEEYGAWYDRQERFAKGKCRTTCESAKQGDGGGVHNVWRPLQSLGSIGSGGPLEISAIV